MKNTLLALMLVSSLFVISCGADATKPQDAYKSQPTETVTGTATGYAAVTADASGAYNTVNIESLQTQYSSTIAAGTKITEIVQVVTVTDSAQGTTTTTTNTNAVTGTTKNADGGIYQFTIDSTATTPTTAYVTYKYSKREAAPTVVKETTGTYEGSTSPLRIDDPYFNDENKRFDKYIVSITDNAGIELEYTQYKQEYTYQQSDNTIKISKYADAGDIFKIKYSYTDLESMTDAPLTSNVTVTDSTTGGNATVTIPLDAALYAGRSYYLKAVIKDTQAGSGGTPTPTTETIYYNKIVPSTGIIDITLTTITKPSATTTTGTYEIWVY